MGTPPPPQLRCDHSASLLYLPQLLLQGEHGQRVEWRKWKQQSKSGTRGWIKEKMKEREGREENGEGKRGGGRQEGGKEGRMNLDSKAIKTPQ